jgi:prefoldin subunit 5
VQKKSELQAELANLKQKQRETESRSENWLELAEKTFDFATYARKAFITGNLQTKKQILMSLGQNPTIKDGILTIEPNEWLQTVSLGAKSLNQG